MSKINKYLNHIQQSLVKNASGLSVKQIKGIANYMGTKHKIIGVGTTTQKQLAKNNYGLEIEPKDL
jgi:hypothetical protein